jgi:hypothetical protein
MSRDPRPSRAHRSKRKETKREPSPRKTPARSSPGLSTQAAAVVGQAARRSSPKLCRGCGVRLVKQSRGRPRSYCSSRCRLRAYRGQGPEAGAASRGEVRGSREHPATPFVPTSWPEKCRQCGARLVQPQRGRPRTTCSSRCRQQAHRKHGQRAERGPARGTEVFRLREQLAAATRRIEETEDRVRSWRARAGRPIRRTCKRCGRELLIAQPAVVVHAIEEIIRKLQTREVLELDVMKAPKRITEMRSWAELALSGARSECRVCGPVSKA